MGQRLTTIVSTDPRLHFGRSQLTCRLDNRFLAVHPMRLNAIEPGTFGRQLTQQDSHFSGALCRAIMRSQPRTHLLRDVPTGIIPNHQQSLFAFSLQLLAQPLQKRDGQRRDRTPRDKAQPQLARIRAQQPVTSQRLGIGIARASCQFLQWQRCAQRPGLQAGLLQARPPHFIRITQHPLRVGRRQTDQPLPRFFLRAYAGSGLVIQSRARFQFTPIRLSVRRMVSSLTRLSVSLLAKQTSATKASVQVDRAFPAARGEVCNRALSRSHLASSKSGATVFGRDEASCKQAQPCWLKAWIALRAVWSLQPNCRAIWRGVCPSALDKRIWQRRSVKACAARRPARNCACSAAVSAHEDRFFFHNHDSRTAFVYQRTLFGFALGKPFASQRGSPLQ
jgi:hypothetical protein